MSKLWVQLGKCGDVMNLLPLLYKDAQSGEKPRLMVAAEFASVLDGVSYVEPVIYDGPHFELAKAVELAKTMSDKVIVTQVNGPADQVRENTYAAAGMEHSGSTSFQKESWKLAGRLSEWDECLPLVFDRRNPEREEKLLRDVGVIRRGAKKPLILLSLGGNSSPFPYAELLRELVKGRFGEDYQIMDLPKAERIYDLLALYEKASLLIATDSAPLHLAWACRELPVFALANDKPALWNGAPWRPNHYWYCRYHDWVDRAVEMVDAMALAQSSITKTKSWLTVWSAYETKTKFVSGSCSFPVYAGMCGRDSVNVLQDTKRVPYLRDVLRMAIQRAENDDVVIKLTRHQVSCNQIFETTPFYAYRIQDEKYRPVLDLFAATKAQWKKMLPEIPDLLLSGDYEWSQALWVIFKSRGASDVTGCSKFFPDAVQTPKTGESKTLLHNRKLCAEVMAKSKVHSRYPRVSEQLEVFPTDLRHCFMFGYNPSIRKNGDGIQIVYRYHKSNASTSLALAEMDALGRVTRNVSLLEIANRSCDDPKFFSHKGEPFVSWVESEYPNNLKAVVKYGRLQGDNLVDVVQPDFQGNDGTTTQKNWVFFSDRNHIQLICLYQCHPEHVVLNKCDYLTVGHKSKAPVWPYGEIRGGTPPVEYNGKLLRFFHSRINNEFGAVTWRYFVGAYLMNPEPPFEVVDVSKKPILYGSEVDDLTPAQRKTCFHRKPNVVFPNGVMEANGCWLLSVGVNDCESLILKVRTENLNL